MGFRDELIDEMGYIICPICFPSYVHCDQKCEECNEYIELKKELEKRNEI